MQTSGGGGEGEEGEEEIRQLRAADAAAQRAFTEARAALNRRLAERLAGDAARRNRLARYALALRRSCARDYRRVSRLYHS